MSYVSPSLRIGVLRGGPSPEYDVSLKSGAHVLQKLAETHRPVDILITKDGLWHVNGFERSPERILRQVDVVFNATHGTFGEDGKLQDLLERNGVRYTGSDKIASAMSMNKALTKDIVSKAGIKTPVYMVVRQTDSVREKAKEIFNSIPHPLVVKPASSGSSVGIYIVSSFSDLLLAIDTVLSGYDSVLVEEYISGKEAACSVIDDFRGTKIYTLPPIEIVRPHGLSIIDYNSKYSNDILHVAPSRFSEKTKKTIEEYSRIAHDVLKLSHCSRSDFIISPRRGVYFLEVNSSPGLTTESLVPKALDSVGVSMGEFIHHLIYLAMNGK